jgi:hypothetical protein
MEVKPGQLGRQMKKRLQAAEMKFMRKIVDFTLLDHKINEDNLKT